jgi:hypothetical protein
MFSFILKILKKLLKKSADFERPEADMCLPKWLFALGLVAILGGLGGIAFNIFYFDIIGIVGSSLALILGMGAVLCYANQKIYMLDNYTFEYITFLGNKKTYRFYDIQSIKKNTDSITLYVANDKVHIESCAIISQRLVEKINEILREKYNNTPRI